MSENRIHVWVQRFADRPALMLQWIDPETGRRKSKSAKTADPKEAEKARADLEYELSHGKYAEASRMTWERFRELVEAEYLPGKRTNTLECYARMLDLFEDICKPKGLRSVTERTVSAFVAGMRKKPGRSQPGMIASTIKLNLQLLHGVLAWAERQGLIPRCPRFPTIKVPRKRSQPIPAESFERLLAKAPDAQTRAFLLCGWLAGLRVAEATALEWEPTNTAPWVDLARNRIWLPAESVKAVEDQWVALDPVLRELLEVLPRSGRRVFRFVQRNGQTMKDSSLSSLIICLARKAGVKLSMRSLRRGFGCRYAARVPAQVLQKLMRHSSIAVTMQFYANVDEAAEEAILGPQRNTSRNKDATAKTVEGKGSDTTSREESTTGDGPVSL